MSCNYKMNYGRTAKNSRVLKSSACAAKTKSSDEATQVDLSSERFSCESLTTTRNEVLIDMMKYKQNVITDKKLMKSSIERICDKADKLNKRLQTKWLRNLTHYVDCVDQQGSSDGESYIFLLREKMKESRAQEVLLLEDEGLLKIELAKLNTISQSTDGVNTTDQLLLLNTKDCVAETCSIIANCISALVKRTMNYQKKIWQIQDNQNTSNDEEDSNTGGYSTTSNSVTLQPKASISICSPVIYQTNLPIPMPVNANNKSPLRGDSDKCEDFLMSGCTQESNKQIVQSCYFAPEGLCCLLPNTNKSIDDTMLLVISDLEEMRISFLPSFEHVYNNQSPEARNEKSIRKSEPKKSIESQDRQVQDFDKFASIATSVSSSSLVMDIHPAVEAPTGRSTPSEAIGHSVESRREQSSSVHPDVVVEFNSKKTSLASNSSDARFGNHWSTLVREPVPVPKGPRNSYPCSKRGNISQNIIKDCATAKLSDILGNSSPRREIDMIVGHPLETYLQNTLPSTNDKKWMGDESDDRRSNVLLNLNSRSRRVSESGKSRRSSNNSDLQEFQAKFLPYITKKPDDNRTILLEGSVGNCNEEVNREERMSALTEEETVISESQYSGSESCINSVECLDLGRILGNTGFSPRKLKVQRKVNSKKEFAWQKKSSKKRAFTDDDEDLRLVIAMAGAKALMIKLKAGVDNSHSVQFNQYSDLIYQELRDFNSVIPEEDSSIQVVIAAARGKVFQSRKQKRILVSPARRDRKNRFSISCTYAKVIRNRIRFSDDTRLSNVSMKSLQTRSPVQLRARKGMF